MNPIRRVNVLATFALLILTGISTRAQTSSPPKPTLHNVPYGKRERQVLDFYQASADRQTPVLFFVHGGGWMSGDKNKPDFLDGCLKSGISVVSLDYRLIPDSIAEKFEPPVKACLDDAV